MLTQLKMILSTQLDLCFLFRLTLFRLRFLKQVQVTGLAPILFLCISKLRSGAESLKNKILRPVVQRNYHFYGNPDARSLFFAPRELRWENRQKWPNNRFFDRPRYQYQYYNPITEKETSKQCQFGPKNVLGPLAASLR